MGVLDKLMFWKKSEPDFGGDDLGLGSGKMDFGAPAGNFGNDLAMPSSEGLPDVTNFRGVGDMPQQKSMERSIHQQLGPDYMNAQETNAPFSSMPPGQSFKEAQSSSQELDVISAKLDAIRANLDSINQRLANLERIAYQDDNSNSRSW
jgi:hypothetical protein